MAGPPTRVTRALVAELELLRDQYHDLKTRSDEAALASLAREEETQRQNAVLTDRVAALENDLAQSREAMEALQQYFSLLTTLKDDFGAFSSSLVERETLSREQNATSRFHLSGIESRLGLIAGGIREIKEIPLEKPLESIAERIYGSGSGTPATPLSDFSIFDTRVNNSPGTTVTTPSEDGKTLTDDEKGGGSLVAHSKEPTPEPELPPPIVAAAEIDVIPPSPTIEQEPRKPLTNGEKYQLVSDLVQQPLVNGDIWFVIPQAWYDGWKKACERVPEELELGEVGPIDTTELLDGSGKLVKGGAANVRQQSDVKTMLVPQGAWRHLVEWYGAHNVTFPRLVMPEGITSQPALDLHPLTIRLYFLLPTGQVGQGDYTPTVILPRKSLLRTLSTVLESSLPPFTSSSSALASSSSGPVTKSIQYFRGSWHKSPGGWFIPEDDPTLPLSPCILEHAGDATLEQKWWTGSAIVVSVKVLDQTTGCLTPIVPFQHPAKPPRILTWSPSCL